MKVVLFFYSVASYALGVAALLYLICFVGDLLVPKTIDSGPAMALAPAVAIDLLLVALFAVQHSLMARPAFKERWTRIVPKAAERSTYVLLTSAVLALLFWCWEPIPTIVWNLEDAIGRRLVEALFWFGWALLLASTFMINHFDLFGLRQMYLRLKDRPYQAVPFVEVAVYRFVRHPIMLGVLIGVWATPRMSAGHLLFAAANTVYIFIGIALEERNTREALGETYERYRLATSMILPLPRRKP